MRDLTQASLSSDENHYFIEKLKNEFLLREMEMLHSILTAHFDQSKNDSHIDSSDIQDKPSSH